MCIYIYVYIYIYVCVYMYILFPSYWNMCIYRDIHQYLSIMIHFSLSTLPGPRTLGGCAPQLLWLRQVWCLRPTTFNQLPWPQRIKVLQFELPKRHDFFMKSRVERFSQQVRLSMIQLRVSLLWSVSLFKMFFGLQKKSCKSTQDIHTEPCKLTHLSSTNSHV